VIEFHILGPVEARDGERLLALGGPRQRALLAILIIARGSVVPGDRLIDELWGERAPATAAKTLQGYISRLRKVLGEEVLLTSAGGYGLAVEDGQIDAFRFERLATQGHEALERGDAAAARELLASALELWRGQPFAGLAYEPFAAREGARLEEARLVALEDHFEADLALGRDAELTGEIEELLGRHPLRERLRGQLMLALYRSGRHVEALDVYRRGRMALAEELGLEPGPDLRELEQRILEHDGSLRRSRSPDLTGPRRGRRVPWVPVAGLLLAGAIAAAAVELIDGAGAPLRATPNTLAAIDVRSNRVTATIPVGARPRDVAVGSGSLWVANLDDQTVSRVSLSTLLPERTIPLDDTPVGLASAAGATWVVGSSPTATAVSVSRIDPEFDSVHATTRVGDVVPDSAAAIATEGRSLWMAPYGGELVRLDSNTGRVRSQVDPNASPAGLAVGDGAVWLTDADADNVVRVDPTGVISRIAVGHEPNGIAVGGGGIWVADTGDDKVMRIDPGTVAATNTISVGAAPEGVTYGAGSIWVADSGDGTVTRIDPHSLHVIATIKVGGSPQAIAVADGRAWVTVDALTVPPAARGRDGGTARLDASGDVTSMDPALAYDPLSAQLLYLTCAKLLNYPDRGGAAGSQLVPEVAQSLPRISNGDRTYTFTIRRGFRFAPPSNAPVTAATFQATIERTLSSQMHSPVAYEYADIMGAAAFTAGRVSDISGVSVRGDVLTIRLIAPAPDFLARMAEPAMCSVPPSTPDNPGGVRNIPGAGPYTIASYTPGQGIVLARNPNYHGSRPHRLARLDVAFDVVSRRAVAQVEAGVADYAGDNEIVTRSQARTLAGRYGRGSPAAKAGHQQYFVNPAEQLDFFALNTHRPLFASRRMRQAVNYAIDRPALAAYGDAYDPLPEHPTDHYIPPGIPGYRAIDVYPAHPDPHKARLLAHDPPTRTVVLYTCNIFPCLQQARIVKTDLAAIGLSVQIDSLPTGVLDADMSAPGPAWDMLWVGWLPDYPDPDAMLDALLEDPAVLPPFTDRTTADRLAAASRLSGPERYLAYAKLDVAIAHNQAPLAAFGNLETEDFFSARMGCQVYGAYGMDLAALCIRK
jgi:YVTN family beta-propeller protein